MNVTRIIPWVTRWDGKRNEDLYKQSNMHIVEVINKNKLRWFGHVMGREEESTLRVVMKLKMKGKRPRGIPRLRWLDNIDSNLKGNNTSLKEVFETKFLRIKNIGEHLFLTQLTGVLEKILELLPGVW